MHQIVNLILTDPEVGCGLGSRQYLVRCPVYAGCQRRFVFWVGFFFEVPILPSSCGPTAAGYTTPAFFTRNP